MEDLLHDSCMRNIDTELSKFSNIYKNDELSVTEKVRKLMENKNRIICELEKLEDEIIESIYKSMI